MDVGLQGDGDLRQRGQIGINGQRHDGDKHRHKERHLLGGEGAGCLHGVNA